jgi:pilin isopeptide linkage protein/LPXTG-motif cell wall-anchored protein
MMKMEGVKVMKKSLVCLMMAVCLLLAGGPASQIHAQEPLSVTLPVSQTLTVTGSTLSSEGSRFTYLMTAKDSSNPMPDGSTAEGYTFTLEGTQDSIIGPITYTHAEPYEYQVKLVSPTDKPGYTIDQEIYDVVVVIQNTDNGGLEQAIYIKNTNNDKVADMSWNHSYQPKPTDSSLMTALTVKKNISGTPDTASNFEFVLKADDSNSPMPEADTVSINGEGTASFATWSYTSTGDYTYKLSEQDSKISNYVYDTSVYTVTDSVTDQNGQLVLARTITDQNGNEVDIAAFTNKYVTGVAGNVYTGLHNNFPYLIGIVLTAGVLLVLYKRRKSDSEQADKSNAI